MPPKIFKNMNFLDFRIFGGDVNRAHGRHSGSSAMPLDEVIHEIRYKNKKWKFSENFYFFDEKYFSKDFEKSKISKSNFFRFFCKTQNFQKVNFFEKTERYSLFEIFDFSKSFGKYFFIGKIEVFGNFLLFIFLSYVMYYLIKWHRGTPTVPPVGAVNVPAENPKIQKIHIFEDFWEHFFLINHIGFSLKYVIPKSSTDFFSSKTKSFSKKIHFLFLIISHAQLMQVASRNSI